MSAPTPMPRWQRIYFAACGWAIGFALTYAAAQWSDWPKLTYFPLARKWELWSTPPGPLPMAYLGLIMWGLGGGLILSAATWLVSGKLQVQSERAVLLAAAWTLTAFAVAGLFFTWNLWPF